MYEIGIESVAKYIIVPQLENTAFTKLQTTIDFAAARNMVVTSTYFEHKNTHKATWESPDGRTKNQIEHVLIDGRHS